MKPASYTPPALWPATTAPEDVPAQVVERFEVSAFDGARERLSRGVVTIYHVAGPLHENARLAAARYAKRGFRVEFTINPRDLVVPLSKPLTRRAA